MTHALLLRLILLSFPVWVLSIGANAAAGELPAASPSPSSVWTVSGGELGVRWNRQLLDELGLHVGKTVGARKGTDEMQHQRFALRRDLSLALALDGAALAGFQSGGLRSDGGYVLSHDGRVIDLSALEIRAVGTHPFELDLVGRDGQSWFRLIRPMYEFSADRRSLNVSTMDVVLGPVLAEWIGRPETAGWTVGDLSIVSTAVALPAPAAVAETLHWPGDPAPNGGVYQVDLFMKSIEFQYSRCDGCTGPGGSGRVVFTPASTLRNNANTGTVRVYTVANDPRGSSQAMWPAGVAWYSKFSGIFPPYQNDQHPYLIWNMYRINADGSIEQIGGSGVKHAYLTTNNDCSVPDDHNSHVLGRGCVDTYTVSHNDNNNGLGPRSEIIPATGQWGRCGSVYDRTCSGTMSSPGYGNYDQRLLVAESQISSNVHPGASYLFESWYVTRGDIDIYNSMATLWTVPSYVGNGWNVNDQSGYRLGPAIDRWVDPDGPGANAATSELTINSGHVKVAVRARYESADLKWRYDYAIANLDVAHAVTSGAEPNLRVLGNDGFDRVRIPIPAAGVTDVRFSDGDGDTGNDWTISQGSGSLVLTAPVGNRLNWGRLFSLSFRSGTSPKASSVNLRTVDPAKPEGYVVGGLLAPAIGDLVFRHGFDR